MRKRFVKKSIAEVVVSLLCMILCLTLPNIRIMASEAGGEYYEAIVEVIKEEIRNGNLQSEEDVRNAIEKAEQQYGIDISEADEEKIIKIVDLAEDLGIDGEKMADIVDEVYEKAVDGKVYDSTEDLIKAVEDQVIDSAAEAVKESVAETVKKSLNDYYNDFVNTMKDFWKRLMSIWKIY